MRKPSVSDVRLFTYVHEQRGCITMSHQSVSHTIILFYINVYLMIVIYYHIYHANQDFWLTVQANDHEYRDNKQGDKWQIEVLGKRAQKKNQKVIQSFSSPQKKHFPCTDIWIKMFCSLNVHWIKCDLKLILIIKHY